MNDNRFADCETPEAVLWRLRSKHEFNTDPDIPDALARIRELTPPPTVSEEARERAVSVAYAAMVEAKKLGPDVLAANRWLDRIIDALGCPQVPGDGYCTCHGDQMGRTADCGITAHRAASTPDPCPDNRFSDCIDVSGVLRQHRAWINPTPAVIDDAVVRIAKLTRSSAAVLDADDLRALAQALDACAELSGGGTPLALELTLAGDTPASAVCDEHGVWKLRIGGDR